MHALAQHGDAKISRSLHHNRRLARADDRDRDIELLQQLDAVAV
jgi:hypothetical protein